jgi:hypothetical protein
MKDKNLHIALVNKQKQDRRPRFKSFAKKFTNLING